MKSRLSKITEDCEQLELEETCQITICPNGNRRQIKLINAYAFESLNDK